MIELTVKDYLNENQEVPAFMEVPETPPGLYIVVEKLGSSVSNHIHLASIAVQSCAPSLYEAMRLNEELKSVMDGMVKLPYVSRVELDTDYNFTDPSTKQYRYQAIYEITYMEGTA